MLISRLCITILMAAVLRVYFGSTDYRFIMQIIIKYFKQIQIFNLRNFTYFVTGPVSSNDWFYSVCMMWLWVVVIWPNNITACVLLCSQTLLWGFTPTLVGRCTCWTMAWHASTWTRTETWGRRVLLPASAAQSAMLPSTLTEIRFLRHASILPKWILDLCCVLCVYVLHEVILEVVVLLGRITCSKGHFIGGRVPNTPWTVDIPWACWTTSDYLFNLIVLWLWYSLSKPLLFPVFETFLKMYFVV